MSLLRIFFLGKCRRHRTKVSIWCCEKTDFLYSQKQTKINTSNCNLPNKQFNKFRTKQRCQIMVPALILTQQQISKSLTQQTVLF